LFVTAGRGACATAGRGARLGPVSAEVGDLAVGYFPQDARFVYNPGRRGFPSGATERAMFAAGSLVVENRLDVASHIQPSDTGDPLRAEELQSSAPFALRLEPMSGGWVRVCVEGELALTSASLLELAVERELDSNSDILLDLSGIDFIDSTGLRAMTTLVRNAKAHGRKLRLSSDLPPHARRLMEIVGLLPFVPIEDDEPETD
jgi:anti-sigma B factor antagonist